MVKTGSIVLMPKYDVKKREAPENTGCVGLCTSINERYLSGTAPLCRGEKRWEDSPLNVMRCFGMRNGLHWQDNRTMEISKLASQRTETLAATPRRQKA